MKELSKKVVKIKKLQKVGDNLMILIPKKWIDELDWNRNTKLVLEFFPYRKGIIISENKSEEKNEEVSDIVEVTD